MYTQDDDGRQITRKERFRFAGVLCGIFIIVLLAQCSACFSAKHTPERSAPTMSDPAVARLSINGPNGASVCTVWKIGFEHEDLLMTAGHCCESDGTLFTLSGSHAYPGSDATVVYDDDVHDVCVMKGELRGAPLAFAPRDPDIGDVVWTAGYPHGTFLISDGYWAGRDDDGDAICSTTVGGGASGSPILNARGQAVGVLTKRYRDMDSLTFATPIEWLRAAVFRARLKLKE